MPLESGRRLGPYEIVAPLGVGGMGEVYEAKDTRLGRTVAIKVLPEGLAESPERRARFEREARTVSQLTHPHVCTLHDVGEEEGIHFLVLEHCEGETLAQRLERGALSLEDTLRLGAQIAEALDAAHRRGVVHRDLKPANVMLTATGVKLLDFGLARLAAGEAGEVADLPTMTVGAGRDLTEEGTVLGTFPYMSPEQVEGGEADARSDIFALGAVLYEMATGQRAFQGKSAASVMAAVLRSEPDPLSKVQSVAPPALDHVVSRCLAKDPEERWQSAKDVAVELRWVAEAGSQAGVAAPVARRRRSRERLAWVVAGVLALVVVVAAVRIAVDRAGNVAETPLRFALPPPENTSFDTIPAVSPDGRFLAFAASDDDDGPVRLWIRPLDSLRAQPLIGTEGARAPFWSPDSRSLGFFADRELKRIDLASGSIRSLARAAVPFGGSWSPQGLILYVDQTQGLLRVPDSGGLPVRLPIFGEDGDRLYFWPHVLPDGARFLFNSFSQDQEGGVYLGSLDGGEPVLLQARSALTSSRAEYDPAGYLLFVAREGQGGPLLAQQIDLDREELLGDPFQVAERVFASGPGEARFSVGPGGLLVIREEASSELGQLTWVNARGEAEATVGPPGPWGALDLSPDGSAVAIERSGEGLWLLDVRRGMPTRLADGGDPVWSPDGRRLAFASGGPPNPFVLDVEGGGQAQRVATFPRMASPADWTPDGTHLVVAAPVGTSSELLLVDAEGGEIEPLLTGDAVYIEGRLSPVGRWLAFVSDETGGWEVYVTSFPRPGRRWRVSVGGGIGPPRWSPDGEALYYENPEGQILRVPVGEEGDTFRAGDPQVVFEHESLGAWDLALEGRLLVGLGTGEQVSPPLIVISDWRAAAGIE